MNKSKIDWCDYTWNPVTGCKHGCEYCYAARIAERFGKRMPDFSAYPKDHNGCHVVDSQFIDNPYPFIFEPTLHAYRLDEPIKKAKGSKIFVCSMADLFGEWVPDEWIKEVFDTCTKANQHKYMFLTKNPSRYRRVEIYKGLSKFNSFIGTTITCQDDVNRVISMPCGTDYYGIKPKTFISIEPIFGFIKIPKIEKIDWVIIGAETGPGAKSPAFTWYIDIVEQCRAANIPVFLKDNLIKTLNLKGSEIIQEFPEGLK